MLTTIFQVFGLQVHFHPILKTCAECYPRKADYSLRDSIQEFSNLCLQSVLPDGKSF